MLYSLDIETKPDPRFKDMFEARLKPKANLKKPEAIAKDLAAKRANMQKTMSLDHDWASVFCVGIKPFGKKAFTLTLEEFSNWLYENVEPEGSDGVPAHKSNKQRWQVARFITFNGKDFDFPVIIKDGIKRGLQLPYGHFANVCERYYKGSAHIDLKHELSFEWNKSKSEDNYCEIYLGKTKTPIDFETCTDQELLDHCIEDIELTEELFNLWNKHFSII